MPKTKQRTTGRAAKLLWTPKTSNANYGREERQSEESVPGDGRDLREFDLNSVSITATTSLLAPERRRRVLIYFLCDETNRYYNGFFAIEQ